MTHVTLHNLTKSYDSNPNAVDNVSLDMPEGQITALLGPSGCGKTTTLKMIAGLLSASSGDIRFDGESVVAVSAEKRNAVMVFQNHLLFPHMSVGENVGFGLRMAGVEKKIRQHKIEEMLALVQLEGYANRRPRQLSGGQQQRIALARALIVAPRVLLLDEPLSNLDAHLRDEMRDLIRSIQRKTGVTTIVVTHDQEEAVILADKIALMFAGKLAQFAPPRAFYDRPASEQVARFFGGINFIPGRWESGGVVTVFGRFQATQQNPQAPTLTLTIRPENIEFAKGQDHNTLTAQVVSRLYVGTHTRYTLTTRPTHPPTTLPLQLIAPASHTQTLNPGDTTTLYLPPDKIWLLQG